MMAEARPRSNDGAKQRTSKARLMHSTSWDPCQDLRTEAGQGLQSGCPTAILPLGAQPYCTSTGIIATSPKRTFIINPRSGAHRGVLLLPKSFPVLVLLLPLLGAPLPRVLCRRLLQVADPPPQLPQLPPPQPPRTPPPPPPASTGIASSSLDFFQLLYDSKVTEIRIANDLTLSAADAAAAASQAAASDPESTAGGSSSGSGSPPPADLGPDVLPRAPLVLRNVTLLGASRGTTTQLDCNFLSGVVRLGPGVTLTMKNLELYRALNRIGQALDFVGRSDGAHIVMESCVQRRAACVPFPLAYAQILSLPPPSDGAEQRNVTFRNESDPSFCWSTSTLLATCKPRSLEVSRLAVYVQPSDGILSDSGGYDLTYVDSHLVCDQPFHPDCLRTASAERCLAQELARLFGGHSAPGPVDWAAAGGGLGEQQGGGRKGGGDDGSSPLVVGLAAGLGGGLGAVLLAGLAAAAAVYVRRRRRRQRRRRSPEAAAGADKSSASGGATGGATGGSVGTDDALGVGVDMGTDDPDPTPLRSSRRQAGCADEAAGRESRKSSKDLEGAGGAAANVATSSSSRGASSDPPAMMAAGGGGGGGGGRVGGPDSGRAGRTGRVASSGAATAATATAAATGLVGGSGAMNRGPSGSDPWDVESIRRSLFMGPRAPEAPLNVQLLQLIGEGSFGKVYKGIWQGTLVALKILVLSGNLTQDQRRRQMAVMEAAISSSMSHPNIVQTYTYSFRPIREAAGTTSDVADSSGSTQPAAGSGAAADQPGGGGGGGSPSDEASGPGPAGASELPSSSRIYGHELLLVLEYCDRGSLRQALDAGFFHRRGSAGGGRGGGPAAAAAAPAGLVAHQEEEEEEEARRHWSGAAAGGGASASAGGGGGGSSWLTPAAEFSTLTGPPPQRLSPPYTAAAAVAAAAPAAGRQRRSDEGGGRRSSWEEPRGAYNYGLMLQVACDIASALLHLHSHGVVHGDVKASNVLLKTTALDERRHLLLQPRAASSPPELGPAEGPQGAAAAAAGGGGGSAGGAGARAAPAAAASAGTAATGTAAAAAAAAAGGPHSATPSASTAGSSASVPGTAVGLVAKVADFGLSTVMGFEGDAELTHVSALTAQGSLTHMAPELMLHGHISKRVDVYAFGILLFELMSGERAHRGVPRALLPHQVAMCGLRPALPPHTPADYRSLVEACWHSEPARRPTTETILRELHRMQAAHAAATAAAAGAASRTTSLTASAAASPASAYTSALWPPTLTRPDGWVALPSLEASTCSTTLFAELVRTSADAAAAAAAHGPSGPASAPPAVGGGSRPGLATSDEAARCRTGGGGGRGGACGSVAADDTVVAAVVAAPGLGAWSGGGRGEGRDAAEEGRGAPAGGE